MSNQTTTSVLLGLGGGVQTVEVGQMPVGEALTTAINRAGMGNEIKIVELDEATGEWFWTTEGEKVILGVNGKGTHTPDPNEPAANYRSLSMESKRKNG